MVRSGSYDDLVKTALGLLVAPALWPLGFVATAILFPGAIEPLLGGLQYVLYLPALMWLLVILVVTLGASTLFKIKKTSRLFFITGAACAVTISLAFGSLDAWGDYRLIGQPGVVYPTHFDLGAELTRIAGLVALSTVATAVTTAGFVGMGGFRFFEPKAT